MNEADKIKISLYKMIFAQFSDNYIAVPEVAITGKIADMLVVSDNINIYEIKSKSDSLKRLPKQIEIFEKYANKVIVVAYKKFIDKLIKEEFMRNIGIISVNDIGKLELIKEAEDKYIQTENYFAYFNTYELRQILRGAPNWYKLKLLEAEKKILEILKPDEIRRLTLFRLKEKFLQEHIKRSTLIRSRKESIALRTRFEERNNANVSSLKEIPYKVFRDFDF